MASIVVERCPHGKGVFAEQDFEKGEVLFQFLGRVLPPNFVFDPSDEGNYFQFDIGSYLDVESLGRYACHSCEPNAGLIDAVTLVAMRKIRKGEEILFDYSTCMMEKSWTLNCACGSKSCRGIIRDFDELDPKLQKAYQKMGIVPQWLLEKSKKQLPKRIA